jgi:3-isopropylmalate/(R)-2-methylmalate dehydratase small subunit
MKAIRRIAACSFALPQANIDTDQIIPARFLTTTTRDGLGRHAFHDWRHRADGSRDPDAVLNRRDPTRERILVGGHNFGCGSSREHAPWALLDFGVEAVISSAIADIFRNNALKNGLLALVVDPAAHARLLQAAGESLEIDVAAQQVRRPDGEVVPFALDPFTRLCLLEGVDELGYLCQRGDLIDRYERARACAA